ncbi:hypothetical protein HRR83_001338 [Exophiala dermatitidis]|nr:hypothetical protein HRR74_001342 [Exophiala dermatitidis]KAJ4526906.1 hypothetical protein HRR73_001703 [Exophiala dermatitidis]KAJ4532618.1 hypothetical protein HRR76_007605 [Exophiala dermatitidis]KAJ4577018.1 hypothetical protein HRR81_003472 [Exophiala dermatitidis]KAJ4583983.1 hypothetical protein HRR82_003317 [Exophiala dermatitidis]
MESRSTESGGMIRPTRRRLRPKEEVGQGQRTHRLNHRPIAVVVYVARLQECRVTVVSLPAFCFCMLRAVRATLEGQGRGETKVQSPRPRAQAARIPVTIVLAK